MQKLLIVDDDVDLLESLRCFFSTLYEVSTAPSAEEAALLIARHSPDVMLLDIVLPGINGVEFLKTVHEKYPHLAVVMMSGTASLRPVSKAMDLGASDYIRKPFDLDELCLVLASALHLSDLRIQVDLLQRELAQRPPIPEPDGRPLKELLDEYERLLIQKALRKTGGVQTRAADLLGTTRRILRYRIEKLCIVFNQ